MRRYCGWVVAAMVAGAATAAWAQEVDPVKPKPPPTATSRPPDRPPRPKEPDRPPPAPAAPPATSPAPPPPPTPEQLCTAAGGEWRDGACDMQRATCLSAGKLWDEQKRKCSPKAAPCPEGTKREGETCVAVPPPPAPAPAPRACERGMQRDGARCVWESAPATSQQDHAVESGGSGGLRTAALIGGDVLLGVGAVTGIVAFSKKGSWSEQCDGKDCYASAEDDYNTGKLLANISTGTFVAGAIFMTAGLFLIPGDDDTGEASAGSVRPAVGVSAGPGGGFMSARWRY